SAGQLYQDQFGIRRIRAAQYRRPAHSLRGRGAGRHRTGLLPALQRDPSHLPRPTDGEYRDRSQHAGSEYADGGTAATIAVADAGMQDPATGIGGDEEPALTASPVAGSLRGAPEGAAGRAATDQRRIGRESRTARPAEPRRRAQEPGDRTGAAGTGREGGATD